MRLKYTTLFLPAILSILLLSFIPAGKKELVFSTDMFSDEQKLRVKGKEISFTVDEKCSGGEMPRDCKSTISFGQSPYQPIEMHGRPYRFASVDMNQDGAHELVVLKQEHGNWREVLVFTATTDRSSKNQSMKWHECLEAFMWYPGFEGEENCPAKIYRTKGTRQYLIITTNPSSEHFFCTKEKLVTWK